MRGLAAMNSSHSSLTLDARQITIMDQMSILFDPYDALIDWSLYCTTPGSQTTEPCVRTQGPGPRRGLLRYY